MNKSELIRAISVKTNMTIKDATLAFDSVIDVISESLCAGEKVQISGFGTFELKTREAREGINPRTKGKIMIPASKLPVFKAGKTLKEAVSK